MLNELSMRKEQKMSVYTVIKGEYGDDNPFNVLGYFTTQSEAWDYVHHLEIENPLCVNDYYVCRAENLDGKIDYSHDRAKYLFTVYAGKRLDVKDDFSTHISSRGVIKYNEFDNLTDIFVSFGNGVVIYQILINTDNKNSAKKLAYDLTKYLY